MIAEISMLDWVPVTVMVVQFLGSVLLGVIGYLLKRQIDQNDRKIEAVCARLGKIEAAGHEVQLDAVVADGLIRERLARDYVARADCVVCSRETRETTTRIFSKIELLQVGQGRVETKLDNLLARKGT